MTKIYLTKYSGTQKSEISKKLLRASLGLFGASEYQDALPKIAKLGKPYFEGGGVFFNLSHSSDFCACAVSDIEVGLDIEQPRVKLLNLQNRILTKSEILQIEPMEQQQKLYFLTERWVIAESIFKHSGEGISKLFGGMPHLQRLSDEVFFVPEKSLFVNLYTNKDYSMALACAKNIRPQLEVLDLDTVLINN